MNRWYLSDIQDALGATRLGADCFFEGVSIDSRTIRKNEIFIALQGENFDGNAFAQEVNDKGASAIITNDKNLFTSLPLLHVKDTNAALAKLASWMREQFAGTVIGVTGSCGKTTVKEILLWILESKYKSLATLANHNNEIGVPLTLCSLDSEHEMAVVEMGATKPGDIDYIAGITNPDIAIITSIAHAHTANMGSLQQVADIKGEIFNYLEDGAIAIIPYNHEYQQQWQSKLTKKKVITFGLDISANYAADNIIMTKDGMEFRLLINGTPQISFRLPLWGKHNVVNLLAAIALAHQLDIELLDIAHCLIDLIPIAGRLEVATNAYGMRIFNDSYNANPEAVMAAIDVLTDDAWQDSTDLGIKRVAILGDMHDLGDYAIIGHQEVGKHAAIAGVDILFTVGSLSANTAQAFIQHTSDKEVTHHHCDNNEQLQKMLSSLELTNWGKANVLVKGSRKAHLEEIVPILQQVS